MSLTRKLLESLGLEADKVSTIIEAHAETVESLKSQIETHKASTEKLAEAEAELGSVKAELETLKANGGDWQKKYDTLNTEYEAYKADQEAKAERGAKENAYKDLLRASGVSEKRIDSIMRVTDLNGLEFTDGKLTNAEELTASIKAEWGDFITSTTTQGAATPTPPSNSSKQTYTREDISKMSRDEINANWEAIASSLSNKGDI